MSIIRHVTRVLSPMTLAVLAVTSVATSAHAQTVVTTQSYVYQSLQPLTTFETVSSKCNGSKCATTVTREVAVTPTVPVVIHSYRDPYVPFSAPAGAVVVSPVVVPAYPVVTATRMVGYPVTVMTAYPSPSSLDVFDRMYGR